MQMFCIEMLPRPVYLFLTDGLATKHLLPLLLGVLLWVFCHLG